MLALLVLAQNSQEAPSKGHGTLLIILGVLIAIAVFSAVATFFIRSSKSSRGGVQEPPASREKGQPPFESIDRER